jgi:hypothetical protein
MHVCVRPRPCPPGQRPHSDFDALISRSSPTLGASVAGFPFDVIYSSSLPNTTIFNTSVRPTVEAWIAGTHGCVFAFGQTNSGKTHTMLGSDGGKDSGFLDGVIPLTVSFSLSRIEEELTQWRSLSCAPNSFRLQLSFVELYNDELRDLLAGCSGKQQLRLREDTSGRVFVAGCHKVTITSPREAMDLVAKGSLQRATGRTNMNEHSSRSHAIVTLHLQHRWRESVSDRNFRHVEVDLHLVDLAGSEFANSAIDFSCTTAAQRMTESIAINTGLYTLGNVIAALAGHRRVGEHIPYRDSALTRLLQNALGGDSRTVMIACINPSVECLDQTLQTLRYAGAAVSIQNAPTVQIRDDAGDNNEDAMQPGDELRDPDTFIDRRAIWIDLVGGKRIFARAMGRSSDPLVLFVHGSGPTNSSTWWASTMFQIMSLTDSQSSSPSYYLVAVDCPGYGRSPGDRQEIRSQPAGLLTDIIHALGKSCAVCAVGSSQGSCAVFNAALDNPSLFRSIAVMDPVGHDVFRYSSIKVPVLLTFDVEDDGHPVKVGRWMRDALPNNTYFEWRGSCEPFWHVDHLPTEILKIISIAESSALRCKHDRAVEEKQTTFFGGPLAFGENRGFGEPIKDVACGLLTTARALFETLIAQAGASASAMTGLAVSRPPPRASSSSASAVQKVWRVEADEQTSRVRYVCDATGDTTLVKPMDSLVVLSAASSAMQPSGVFRGEEHCLFAEERAALQAQERRNEESAEAKKARFLAQTACDACRGDLWMPRRAKVCEHVLCVACYEKTGARWTEVCPVCSTNTSYSPILAEHQAALASVLSLGAQQGLQQLVHRMSDENSRVVRIVVEYGNTAVPAPVPPCHTIRAFAKIAAILKGSNVSPLLKLCTDAARALTRVEFDINPDFPKAAIKVSSAPFTLERTMSLKFTCNIRLCFTPSVGVPVKTLVIPYEVEHAPVTLRRLVIILRLPDTTGKSAAASVATVDHGQGVFMTLPLQAPASA